MTGNGIEALVVGTHNWGRSVAFWQALGYELDLETDHHSGRLHHAGGGPDVFVAELPAGHELSVTAVLTLDDLDTARLSSAVTVEQAPRPARPGTVEMVVRDPDGRPVRIRAAAPEHRPT